MQLREWPAFYYDGRTAERQAITLTLAAGEGGGGVRLHLPDGSRVVWPIDAIRQTQGSFSSEQVRLEHGSDPVAAVLVDAPGFTDALRAAFPQASRRIRGHRQTARLVGWSVGALISAVALYLWGAPAAAGWIAARVPPSWEVSLGHGVADRVTKSERLCHDTTTLADLRLILDRLLAAQRLEVHRTRRESGSSYDFRLVVIRDTLVNAFAAPGGFIAVHSGLLHASRTPEEFAGVLAHEIQHVLLRHSTRGIIRDVPMRLAISAIGGGTGVESAAWLAGSLGALRYRRADESEADREGFRLLVAARVDPRGSVDFMRTLSAQYTDAPRLVSYLSSHPHTPDRVAQLEALAAATTVDAEPLLPASRWERVRATCRDA